MTELEFHTALAEKIAFVTKAQAVFWAAAAGIGGWPQPVPIEAYFPTQEAT